MSTITKEQAKDLRNAFNCWQQDYDPVEDKEQYDMFGLGMVAMDALLSSLEAEPVAFRSKLQPPTAIGSEHWDYTDHRQPDAFELENCVIEHLYTAPPVPVSVPDEYVAAVPTPTNLGYEAGWNACRSAMLQGAEHVSNRDELPEGWVACSERMPEGMTDVHISNGHDVGQGWWDGDTWQTQHDYYSVPGEVTHWQPLPSPPVK